MKNGHLEVHSQSTEKHSYPPESFIIITCVLLTMPDIGKDCQIDNILKVKELFLLRSFYIVQVYKYLIILLSLFQALVFYDYSNFFRIKEHLQYPL